MNKKKGLEYLFEPIVLKAGELLGFELVIKYDELENPVRADNYLYGMTPSQKVKIFFEQVTIACLNASIFIDNGLLLAINVDYEIALHICNNDSIRNILTENDYIRLEVNEVFPELEPGKRRPLLHKLGQYCPLWLDNFGSGHTSLSLAMNERFEYIKISKSFFWQHQGTFSLKQMVNYLQPYCKGSIVNGVENSQHIEYLSTVDIQAMQGLLWLPYTQDELSHNSTFVKKNTIKWRHNDF